MAAMRGRAGQQLGQGFSGKKTQLGVKMSTAVKQVGCSNLKALIEDDNLIIKDYDTIAELTTFIQKGNSFQGFYLILGFPHQSVRHHKRS